MIQKLKYSIVVLRDLLIWQIIKIRYFLLSLSNKKPLFEGKNTPIIINNFNRLTYLKDLIDKLKDLGYNNLYVLDNNSSYEPLLKYYDTNPCKIIRLKKNLGHLSFTKSGVYKQFKNKFFVYTDSDILPNVHCPENFMEYLYEIMMKYKASKVGFAIKFEDLPDSYALKKFVELNHKKLWENQLEENVYKARIDTTFALHFPNMSVGWSLIGKHLRIGGNCVCKHQPWYVDSKNLTEEEINYINTSNKSASWAQLQKNMDQSASN